MMKLLSKDSSNCTVVTSQSRDSVANVSVSEKCCAVESYLSGLSHDNLQQPQNCFNASAFFFILQEVTIS